MDEEKRQKRIHQVARSLKELHVVSTMEEALERARDIVGKTDQGEKSIGELTKAAMKKRVGESEKEHAKVQEGIESSRSEFEEGAISAKKGLEKDVKGAKFDKKEVKEVKEEVKQDIHVHKLESGDVKASKKEVDVVSHAVDDVEEIVEEADKVQGKDD